MKYFKIPSDHHFRKGEQIIQCRQNDGGEWVYRRKIGGYHRDILVPTNSPIYDICDELEELTLLANAEPTEINGLIVLFVRNSTMELINPVEINR